MENNSFLESLKFDVKPRTKSVVQEFLEVAQILQAEGIKILQIKQKIGGRENPRFTIMSDLKENHIDVEKLTTKYPELKADYPIGRRINEMKRVLNGNDKRTKVTEEEMQQLHYYLDGKKSANQELIEVIKIIEPDINANIGGISNITLRVNGSGVTLSQLYYEGDISSQTRDRLKEAGYEYDFPLGQRIIRAKRMIDGKVKAPEAEINELKKHINPSREYNHR